jgi:adenine-specific DNA-methyltransferase
MQSDNLYIVGDAEVKLKDIESSSIKLIYIDPPYNTGSKFVYNDKRQAQDWIEFMKNKLIQSKRILKDEGVIFISIDDNEYANLQLLSDEIFGSSNKLGTLITRQATRSNSKHINTIHEYVLCYAKNKSMTKKFETKRVNIPIYGQTINKLTRAVKSKLKTEGKVAAEKELKKLLAHYDHIDGYSWLKNYNLIDEKGNIYFAKDLSTPGKPKPLDIPELNINLEALKTRSWTRKERIIDLHNKGELVFKNKRPYRKSLLVESKDSLMSFLNFYSRQGVHDLDKLGLKGLFDTPKPVSMIKLFILCVCDGNDVVLDYFSGSATTGQAVWEVNDEQNYNLKFILIQQEEPLDIQSTTARILESHSYEAVLSNAGILRLNTVKHRLGKYDFKVLYDL